MSEQELIARPMALELRNGVAKGDRPITHPTDVRFGDHLPRPERAGPCAACCAA